MIQITTAVATFLLGLLVFYILGYTAFVSLALLAVLLQFIPVLGPSLLIVALALVALVSGNTFYAIQILVLGIGVVSALPDLVIRPRIADMSTKLSPSLYLTGFIGGLSTLGAIGVLAGPIAIATVLETFEILADQK